MEKLQKLEDELKRTPRIEPIPNAKGTTEHLTGIGGALRGADEPQK
ncbi:MAG: hypothetical protein ISS76_15485 [Phycisphaerae bacterium]|nr:hypothetical protein [Phycisphaerae bacterium]